MTNDGGGGIYIFVLLSVAHDGTAICACHNSHGQLFHNGLKQAAFRSTFRCALVVARRSRRPPRTARPRPTGFAAAQTEWGIADIATQ